MATPWQIFQYTFIYAEILSHMCKQAKSMVGLLIWVFWFCTEPPPIIQVPNNVTVTPGERAVLSCLVTSAVGYNLTWQRSGRDVRLADSARIQTLANLSLELKSVKTGDAGEYRCVVSSEGGSAAASVFLTVQGTVLLETSAQGCSSTFLLPPCKCAVSEWQHLGKHLSSDERMLGMLSFQWLNWKLKCLQIGGFTAINHNWTW